MGGVNVTAASPRAHAQLMMFVWLVYLSASLPYKGVDLLPLGGIVVSLSFRARTQSSHPLIMITFLRNMMARPTTFLQ